jgi:hypothetical protein
MAPFVQILGGAQMIAAFGDEETALVMYRATMFTGCASSTTATRFSCISATKTAKGWTVLAIDRATRRWAVAQADRQVDAAERAYGRLYADA